MPTRIKLNHNYIISAINLNEINKEKIKKGPYLFFKLDKEFKLRLFK